MIRDISERKQLEKELLNSVIKTEEKERLNFSQELHDGLGPLLSAAKMYIDWLGKPNANIKKEELIPEIKMLLEEAGNSIRDISFKLSPHILQNYGIIEALKAYSQKIMSSGKIKITLNNNHIPRLPEVTETVIYRVICECINNTIKHARAHSIIINFILENNLLSISYSDDGIGFDVENILISKKGLGLLNMQSRLKSINGQISFTSIPQKGTTIYLQTPYF